MKQIGFFTMNKTELFSLFPAADITTKSPKKKGCCKIQILHKIP